MRAIFYSNPVLQCTLSLSWHHVIWEFNKHALYFVTQTAIEIPNSPEPRTDSCRTSSVHSNFDNKSLIILHILFF